LGSQCTNYLQQHKLVLTCVAWGADRKDAVLHSVVLIVLSSPPPPPPHVKEHTPTRPFYA
jgi:hypothetical protein